MQIRKHSRKRDAILREIMNTDVHPSAEWVYRRLKKEYPDLSLATVYRNIAMFRSDGTIRSVGIVGGEERFDADTSFHPHFICKKCGKVMDINLSGEFFDNAVVSRMNGIEIVSHDITFYGYCEKCSHGGN